MERQRSLENRNIRPISSNTILLLALNGFAVTCTLIYLSTFLLGGSVKEPNAQTSALEEINETSKTQKDGQNEDVTLVLKENAMKQPTTHISYIYVVLNEILKDVEWNGRMCSPEDVTNLEKHRIPKFALRNSKNKNNDPRETIAVYISVGLLLTSLGAAVFELYKEKIQPVNAKAKPTLTKRCTLADLTVLRHSRKELMRRDSVITDGAWESSGNKHSSSLIRRCSLPVIPGDLNHLYLNSFRYGSRRISFDCHHQQHGLSEHRSSHVLLVRRH